MGTYWFCPESRFLQTRYNNKPLNCMSDNRCVLQYRNSSSVVRGSGPKIKIPFCSLIPLPRYPPNNNNCYEFMDFLSYIFYYTYQRRAGVIGDEFPRTHCALLDVLSWQFLKSPTSKSICVKRYDDVPSCIYLPTAHKWNCLAIVVQCGRDNKNRFSSKITFLKLF